MTTRVLTTSATQVVKRRTNGTVKGQRALACYLVILKETQSFSNNLHLILYLRSYFYIVIFIKYMPQNIILIFCKYIKYVHKVVYHHHYLYLKFFHHPHKNSFPFPLVPGTSILLLVSMNLFFCVWLISLSIMFQGPFILYIPVCV